LLHPTTGAHRASRRFHPRRALLGIGLAGSVIASLAAAPTAGAATMTNPLGAEPTVALTTTAIDKPWYTTEQYYFGLMNCTRTGGWVLSNGTCRGYGSGHYSAYRKPFMYSYGLSDRVTRPYAKLLATRGLCSHTADGDPGLRLRRSGYTSWRWGENIGCREGYSSSKTAVLASHLNFQAEKSSNGGHWKNIKSTSYKTVGIGVWVSGSHTRLVIDFYG
jgi:hypothetical protein